ncbi:hypothetical protein BT63DRAFT_480218 [Microthyrium microscopicum]|uniref:Cytochrome b561 domain-containing protein n=1 Tax=Microthyrium microscopicum TaxID=703497 RepID=A0A6A6U9K2_9PEZI|nr:hypothetical protein BT63DRAFT_480218 [Microthyrium microscopicum]
MPRLLSPILLTILLLISTIHAWCPPGTWQDQNGHCHARDPYGWRDPPPNYYDDRNRPHDRDRDRDRNQATRDRDRDNVAYSRANHPSYFFSSHRRGAINPLRARNPPPSRLNVDWKLASNVRTAHGIMAALAFVALFPIGAISAAILPGMLGVGVHVVVQMLGFVSYLIAFAMGIWLCSVIRWRDFDLFSNYHPIIGMILFVIIFFQPVSGALHHRGYKNHGRRGGCSYLHVWLGRIAILVGMINGGLGLYIAGNATRGQVLAYGVTAALVLVIWGLASCCGAFRRHRKNVPRREKRLATGERV